MSLLFISQLFNQLEISENLISSESPISGFQSQVRRFNIQGEVPVFSNFKISIKCGGNGFLILDPKVPPDVDVAQKKTPISHHPSIRQLEQRTTK